MFYRAVEYEDSPLAVVQYWLYSAFDQFTTNFHWHDWELLQVFVDTGSGEPQLYVASSHSRRVPNNEFLDPPGGQRPRILPELGSHSGGLSVNRTPDRFQRFPSGEELADITNGVLDRVEDLLSIPLAYGLPRDEGLSLPYVLPELDGAPVHEHERLPAVERSDLLPAALTVRSLDAPGSPPTALPARETGLLFEHRGRETTDDAAADAVVDYGLVPTAELEQIDGFTGPQLSFEFAIPGFAEDAVAEHITTASAPWTDPRYDAPASDVTDPRHRRALSDRYDAIGDPSPIGTVVAGVTNAVTADDAPEGEGLTTVATPIETVALLESDPEAAPTFRGVLALRDVPEGEHTLTVNGAGVAPHSEAVAVPDAEGEPAVAGVDGEIPLVAREEAVKLGVDPRGADSDLTDLAVADDFAGRLYDAPLSGPDAVYVHRGGAFTTEVRDSAGEVGAYRVTPSDEEQVRIDDPATGKTPLARYLADVAEETRAEVAAVADDTGGDGDGGGGGDSPGSGDGAADGGSENAVQGLARALAAVAEAARRAADSAAAGDRGAADEQLEAVATRLGTVSARLSEASDALPRPLVRATEHRLDQARRRTEQARKAETL